MKKLVEYFEEGKIRNKAHSVLLLAAQFVKTDKTGIAEQMPDEMGSKHFTRESAGFDDRTGRENSSFHGENGGI